MIQLKKTLLNLEELKLIISFNEENESITLIDSNLIEKISLIIEDKNVAIEERNDRANMAGATEKPSLEVANILKHVADELFKLIPKIIFFDDFCDLLPDQITISDIDSNNKEIKGLQAVKNIETILGAEFTKLETLPDGRREKTITNYHETITADFNEKWKQRIGEGSGAKVHVKFYRDSSGVPYIKFYIETKKGEFLSVDKRSQGFKWFLSFYLQLKAEDKNANNLIILFDEPGLYLHSKAQLDMIKVFEELSNRNQIIYSTHSPYLIDTGKIHRLKLVINTKKSGTTIEKITSNKINNQKDALKPIIDALGLEVASPFSVAKKNNIILEGISDFHYINAMKQLLNKEYDIGILPSMGSSNSHLLMELCIGWGLDWVMIFDDKGATKDYNKIKKNFFNDDDNEAQEKILILKDCDGIEDMFTLDDLKLVDPEIQLERKNSEIVSSHGGKELFSRLFFEKVMNGNITKDKLSPKSIQNFEEVFTFIEDKFNIRK